jgi:hypothetical protein
MSRKNKTCRMVRYKSRIQQTDDFVIQKTQKSSLLPLLPEDTCSISNFEIIRGEDDFKEYEYKPQTEEQYRRYKKFMELNSVCKRVILRMYKSFKDYMETQNVHPLEETVFLLYKFWDSESTIRAIASRIGIYIGFDNDYTASEILLDKLISILEKNPDSRKITEIINMSETQFRRFALKIPEEDFDAFYQNRLAFILGV